MVAWLTLGFASLAGAGYFSYSRLLARFLDLDSTTSTPAHALRDDLDYVPTKPFYLFAQHFSAIAAAGPIAGPILAAQTYGWLPCAVWIVLGVIFVGATHDFMALIYSVRHGARSIADIAADELGRPAGRALTAFIWLALIYVIIAFVDMTAGTFVAGSEELRAIDPTFNPGGAVAAASIAYLFLAVLMGMLQRFFGLSLWIATIVFVPLSFAAAYAGTLFSNVFVFSHTTWALLIIGYCAVASVVPVWALLQPRGYLGGFILFSALAVGIVGVLWGGYEVTLPLWRSDTSANLPNAVLQATTSMVPFLFVTIACGACSGFHGLVCSGTTSKQIDREPHTRAVGYGAMLAEGLVAILALSTVMIASPDSLRGAAPGTIYGRGIGSFITLIIGEQHLLFAITFGAMAFSTFVFDTLDVATRLGRYLVQEFFGWKGLFGATLGTVLTLAIPASFLLAAGGGAWQKFWIVFGASNQLLAGLTLLTVTVWLFRDGKPVLYTFVPTIFVLSITLWALLKLVFASAQDSQGFDLSMVNSLVALSLVALAVFVLGAAGVRALKLHLVPPLFR